MGILGANRSRHIIKLEASDPRVYAIPTIFKAHTGGYNVVTLTGGSKMKDSIKWLRRIIERAKTGERFICPVGHDVFLRKIREAHDRILAQRNQIPK